MNPRVGLVVLIVYAVLLIVGGVIGFVKARSRPSLIAGVVSGILALIAAWISSTPGSNEDAGYSLALLLAVILFIFFGYRASKTRKFMPGGLLAVASVLVIGVMLWSIVF
jgi:uncharacterized membrane protein (UPF0136 family)